MRNMTRRGFVRSAAPAAFLSSVALAGKRSKRLPLAFSTLGCPRWDWKTILQRASDIGFAGIEIRGIRGEMDLPKRPEFKGAAVRQSLADLKAVDLRVVGLGSSVQLHHPDPAKRKPLLDSGREFIDLAHELKAPYVRVFGDKYVEGEQKQVTLDRVIAGLRELGEHAKGSGVSVLIESHGDFHDAPTLLHVLKKVDLGNVGLLWDAHHTFVSGKEAPGDTFRQLRRYVKHTHLKDSRPEGSEVRYVLFGTGTVPVRETVHVLAKGGYRGYYSLEWEKGWHPEIEEPEVAFPHFVKVITEYLSEVGVKG